MKKYIIVVSCLLAGTMLHAQSKWSLRQCIDYAVEHNIEIKQQELEVKSAEVDLNTSKNSRLPNLNGSVDQSFSFGRSLSMSTNTYDQKNSSNTSVSLSTNIPVFTGFRIPNQIKRDEFKLDASVEGLQKAKENLQVQIAAYYLDVLFKKEILGVYKDQAALTQTQVEKTIILVESGKVAQSQLYDIKAQFAKDELNITTADNDLNNSLLLLSQALNLSENDNFDIETPNISNTSITDNTLESLMQPNVVYQRAIEIKPHVKEAQFQLEGSKRNLKVAQSGYWPTLNLGASYNNGFNHIYGEDNISISSQWKNNYRGMVGLTLSIPIFDRFETRNSVRKARLNIENQELILDNVKLTLYKEIQQAYQNAVAAQAKYNSTEKASQAAEESFKYAEIRYQIGKISVFEYGEAQTKLTTTKSEQLQAKYDFVFRSKILDFYQGKEINI